MTKEQRTAIVRIISDMIKADNIIEESGIKDMKKLMSEYSITHQEMGDARKIRFSDAVNTLKELSLKERKTFFDHIYSIALSDNICVPREALLLIALQYCLIEVDKKSENGTPLPKPYLISCPTGEASFNDQYMVYLESSYDEERNEELKTISSVRRITTRRTSIFSARIFTPSFTRTSHTSTVRSSNLSSRMVSC